jgi:hypothetical protein
MTGWTNTTVIRGNVIDAVPGSFLIRSDDLNSRARR